MTGRELILYILENNLEDEPIFKDGRFLEFIPSEEAAVELGVGVETINVLVTLKQIPGMVIGNTLYIPKDFKEKYKRGKHE